MVNFIKSFSCLVAIGVAAAEKGPKPTRPDQTLIRSKVNHRRAGAQSINPLLVEVSGTGRPLGCIDPETSELFGECLQVVNGCEGAQSLFSLTQVLDDLKPACIEKAAAAGVKCDIALNYRFFVSGADAEMCQYFLGFVMWPEEAEKYGFKVEPWFYANPDWSAPFEMSGEDYVIASDKFSRQMYDDEVAEDVEAGSIPDDPCVVSHWELGTFTTFKAERHDDDFIVHNTNDFDYKLGRIDVIDLPEEGYADGLIGAWYLVGTGDWNWDNAMIPPVSASTTYIAYDVYTHRDEDPEITTTDEVSSTSTDEFIDEEDPKQTDPPKKKAVASNIALGLTTALALTAAAATQV